MAKVMVVGTFHMESQSDRKNLENPERIYEFEEELQAIVESLSDYRPTKIGVEWEAKEQDRLLHSFDKWQAGQVKSTNEIVQLAFPLVASQDAALLAFDWMEEGQGLYGFGDIMEEVGKFPALEQELASYEIREPDLNQTIRENLRYYNSPECVQQVQAYYTNLARVGEGERQVGIGWLIWWYQRNLMIFSRLLDQLEEDDRLLILIGAAHKGILEGLLADSQQVELVDVRDYL